MEAGGGGAVSLPAPATTNPSVVYRSMRTVHTAFILFHFGQGVGVQCFFSAFEDFADFRRLANANLNETLQFRSASFQSVTSTVAPPRATRSQHACMGDISLPSTLMVPSQNKPNTLKLNSVAREASRYSARDPRLR